MLWLQGTNVGPMERRCTCLVGNVLGPALFADRQAALVPFQMRRMLDIAVGRGRIGEFDRERVIIWAAELAVPGRLPPALHLERLDPDVADPGDSLGHLAHALETRLLLLERGVFLPQDRHHLNNRPWRAKCASYRKYYRNGCFDSLSC